MVHRYRAPRPGAWLREDIADILTALAQSPTNDVATLDVVALSLGLSIQGPPSDGCWYVVPTTHGSTLVRSLAELSSPERTER
jgi:hypothetical protein